MGWKYWLKRFLLAFIGAALVLLAIELLKGHEPQRAALFAAAWGTAFAVIFTLIGYVRYRRNPACMLPVNKR